MKKKIVVENVDVLMNLFGSCNANVGALEDALNVTVSLDAEGVQLTGREEDLRRAEKVLAALSELAEKEPLTLQHIGLVVDAVKEGRDVNSSDFSGVVATNGRGRQVRVKTLGQKNYVDAITRNAVTFGVGPAGTGKTYLAVALAVRAYKNKEIERIILTRPAVEAGEKLGFLPGDLQEKVDPYLRPLYDALNELVGAEGFQKMVEKNAIEVAPLAYMRGRTLSNSFIILDEAQNTTSEQMKMFLTRMGENSRVVVNGDITQIDLPPHVRSGMVHALSVLKGVEGIGFVELTYKDVVRHPLVARIIRAYEQDGKGEN